MCLNSCFINHYRAPCTLSFVSTTMRLLCSELTSLAVSPALNVWNCPSCSAEGSQSSMVMILCGCHSDSSPSSLAQWECSAAIAVWCSRPEDLILCDWRISPYPDREQHYFLSQPLLRVWLTSSGKECFLCLTQAMLCLAYPLSHILLTHTMMAPQWFSYINCEVVMNFLVVSFLVLLWKLGKCCLEVFLPLNQTVC